MSLLINDTLFDFSIDKLQSDHVTLNYKGQKYSIQKLSSKEGLVFIECNGKKYSLYEAKEKHDEMSYSLNGKTFFVKEKKVNFTSTREESGNEIKSPMPGKVFKVLKEIGDEVVANESLLVLEAMKMEHEIKSPRAGKIKNIFYHVGQQVSHGNILVELE